MLDPPADLPDADTFEAQLRRRQARLDAYMKFRGYALGSTLLVLGALSAVLTVVALLAVLGVVDVEALRPWTQDHKAVLALGVPGALTVIFLKSGKLFWSERDPRSGDPPDLDHELQDPDAV